MRVPIFLRFACFFAGVACLFFARPAAAQLPGSLSGDLQMNQNFFRYDSALLGANPPTQYLHQLSSTEAWLNLNYRQGDYSFGLRFDAFQNSNLRNPREVFSGQGLGYWYARRAVDKLDITVGYFYDQFGSGITFRAYEARSQALDYAMKGIRLIYKPDSVTTIKAFGGQQKYRFGNYEPIIKGANIERFVTLGKKSNLQLTPGLSLTNRTLDEGSMATLVQSINALPVEKRFVPKYNVFAYSFYNTLQYKNINWFVEAAAKSKEAGLDSNGTIANKPGSVVYSSLTYSQKGFGINGQFKRTETYELRTSPLETRNDGFVNYIPPLARMNTWRLTSRYSPATQLLGEQGFSIDATFSRGAHFQYQFNHSWVQNLAGRLLYREFYAETKQRWTNKLRTILGVQVLYYNQGIYEGDKEKPSVRDVTPFVEVTYRLNSRRSLRVEASHMSTKQDLGNWAWGLMEYNVAPRYSFSLMDMWNYGNPDHERRFHYWTAFGAANFGRNRITLGYVRQVEGINCTGGVCRLEPAFNGVKATLTSSF